MVNTIKNNTTITNTTTGLPSPHCVLQQEAISRPNTKNIDHGIRSSTAKSNYIKEGLIDRPPRAALEMVQR